MTSPVMSVRLRPSVVIPLLALASALACGGRGAARATVPPPAGTPLLLPDGGGAMYLRLLRADSAMELDVRERGGDQGAARAIVPVAGAAALPLAARILDLATRVAAGMPDPPDVGYRSGVGEAAILVHRVAPRGRDTSAVLELQATEDGRVELHVALTRAEARRLAHGLRRAALALPMTPGDSTGAGVITEFDADAPARMAPGSCAPRFPPLMRERRTSGAVEMDFVIDSAGRVDPATVAVLHATDPAFERAVLDAVPCFRYVPPRAGGRPVRMATFQDFAFAVVVTASGAQIADVRAPGPTVADQLSPNRTLPR